MNASSRRSTVLLGSDALSNGAETVTAGKERQRSRQACAVRSNRRVSAKWVVFTTAEVATITIAIAAARR